MKNFQLLHKHADVHAAHAQTGPRDVRAYVLVITVSNIDVVFS